MGSGDEEDSETTFPNMLSNQLDLQGTARYISKYQQVNNSGKISKGGATSCVLAPAQPVPRDLDFAPERGSKERESSENGRFRWAWRKDLRRGNRC